MLAPLALQLSQLGGQIPIRFLYTTATASALDTRQKYFLDFRRAQAKLGGVRYLDGRVTLVANGWCDRADIDDGEKFEQVWGEFLRRVTMRIVGLDTAKAQRAASRALRLERLDRFKWAQKCRDTNPTDRA